MVDQVKPPLTSTPAGTRPAATSAFAPQGQPVIEGVNRIGLTALYIKEVRRFLKVQTQTIWGPAVSTLLFLIIFDVALGRGGRTALGVPFTSFLAPGLIVMAMMQNAFANSSFSLLAGKIQGTIIDLLMPPLSNGELMTGIVAAAVTRGLMIGVVMAGVIWLYPAADLHFSAPLAIVWFGLMGTVLLSLFGLLTSIWAEKFDHNAAISTLVVAPLSLLSGTFYTIDNLHAGFETISRFNPFFYVISGFRYGFLGETDIGSGVQAVISAGIGLFVLNAVLAFVTYRLLQSGWKLKA